MKYITLTLAQRTLLQALYDKLHMRYLVYDNLADCVVYTKQPLFNQDAECWYIPNLGPDDVEYLSAETVWDLADKLNITLQENPFPLFWLSRNDPVIPIGRLLELTANNPVTTLEAVLDTT